MANDDAYDLVIAVASGHLTTVAGIAEVLAAASKPWGAG